MLLAPDLRIGGFLLWRAIWGKVRASCRLHLHPRQRPQDTPHNYWNLAALAAPFVDFELLLLTRRNSAAALAAGIETSRPSSGERGRPCRRAGRSGGCDGSNFV